MSESLYELSLRSLLDRVAEATPAPGGGSAAALAGATGAALIEMVAGLSLAKANENVRPKLETISREASRLRATLVELVERDTQAYLGVVNAFRIPKHQEGRQDQIQEAFWEATRTPLETLDACRRAEDLAKELEPLALDSTSSDQKTALALVRAGAVGALENVRINLPSIKSAQRKQEVEMRLEAVDADRSDVPLPYPSRGGEGNRR